MKNMKNGTFIVLMLISLTLLTPLLISLSAETLETIPLISGYQGIDFIYDSVNYKNYWYSANTYGPNPNFNNKVASAHSFGDRLNLDPDSSGTGLPNLHAEQMGFTVDKDFFSDVDHWYFEVADTSSYTDYKEFQIQKFRCTWKMNLWLDGTYEEAKPEDLSRYFDAELWVQLVPQVTQYFEGNPDELVIAPVYIAVENVEWYSGKDNPNQSLDPSQGSKQDIFPETRGVTMGIYRETGGSIENVEDQIKSYKGQLLDPNIFRDNYYIRFGIDRFSADSQYDLFFWWNYKYPSLQLEMTVHVFAIGEWNVRLDKDEIPNLGPHQVDWGETWTAMIGRSLIDFATSPLGWITGIIGLVLLVFVLLGVLGLLPTLVSFFGMIYAGKQMNKKDRG